MEITKQCLGVGEEESILEGLKISTFTTTLKLIPHTGQTVEPVKVVVDHKAAVRQAIIVAVRKLGVSFKTRSEWKAQPSTGTSPDWDYHSIALHHAGNSFSCSADGVKQLRKAEATDINSFGFISYHYAIDCSGTVYEALDLRNKGAHVEGGNSGIVGIVLLEDLTNRGEVRHYGPSIFDTFIKKGFRAGLRELGGEQADQFAFTHDTAPVEQVQALQDLVSVLKNFFNINTLGGHREFALTHGSSRACPGANGLAIAKYLRDKYSLGAPKK